MSSMYKHGMGDDDAVMPATHYPDTTLYQPDEPSPRGEDHTPIIAMMTTNLLRSGLLLQLLSLLGTQILYKLYGGNGVFVHNIYAGSDVSKISSSFHMALVIMTLFHIKGTMMIAVFQAFVADNSKLSRGFRIGSKFLATAALFDLLSSTFRLAQYYFAYRFMSLQWWSKFQQTAGDWSISQLGSMISSVSLIIMGAAFFFMETYHDEGVDERQGYVVLALYAISGLAEMGSVFADFGSFYSLVLILALLSANNWASRFEPVLLKYAPPLHSRDLNADVLPPSMLEGPGAQYSMTPINHYSDGMKQ